MDPNPDEEGRKAGGDLPTFDRIVGLLARSSIQNWMNQPLADVNAQGFNGPQSKTDPSEGYVSPASASNGEGSSPAVSHGNGFNINAMFFASSYDTLLCQALSSALTLPSESPPTLRSSPPSAQKRKRSKSRDYTRSDTTHSPTLECASPPPTTPSHGSPGFSPTILCSPGQFSTSPVPMSTSRIKSTSRSPNPKSPKTPRRGDQVTDSLSRPYYQGKNERFDGEDVDMVSTDNSSSSHPNGVGLEILKPAVAEQQSVPIRLEFDSSRPAVPAESTTAPNSFPAVTHPAAEQGAKTNDLGQDGNTSRSTTVEGTKSAFTGMI